MSTHMHRGRLLAATTAVVLAAAPASAFALASDGGGVPGAVQAVRVSQPAPASGGFAWDDALIGVGVGVGAVAVGLGTAGAIGIGRSRRQTDRGVLLG